MIMAETVGAKMLMGRDFSKEYATDTAAIIINQAALDIMQLENPIGAQLDLWGENRTLIGVIDNILMGSPYEQVRPMFMVLDDWGVGAMTLRVPATNDVQGNLAQIQEVFEQYNPAYHLNIALRMWISKGSTRPLILLEIWRPFLPS